MTGAAIPVEDVAAGGAGAAVGAPAAAGLRLRRGTAPLLVGAIVLAIVVQTMTVWPVGVFYDDGIYVILAKALATGEGYRYLNLPGHPAATHYPPAYPALLAMLWKLWPAFPSNAALFKLVNAILVALSAVGAYCVARSRLGLSARAAALTVVAFTVAIPMVAISNVLFSEPLFLALLMPSLLASERLADDGGEARAIAPALLAGLVTLTRSIGIAAVVAPVVVLLARRRHATAASFAAAVACVLMPWQLWVAVHNGEVPAVLQGSYGSYTDWFFDAMRARGLAFVPAVVAKNAASLFVTFRVIFTPAVAPWARTVLVLPLAAVFAIGLWRMVRRAPVTALFLALYMAIVLLWPYEPGRFTFGVWPLFGWTLALGVMALWERRPALPLARVARAALLAGAAMSAAVYARYNARGYLNRWWESEQHNRSMASMSTVNWVGEHTRPGDVVATAGDPMMYLYTERLSVPPSGWTATEYVWPRARGEMLTETRSVLTGFDVRYLLVERPFAAVAPVADEMLHSSPPSLRLVDTLPEGGAVFIPVKR